MKCSVTWIKWELKITPKDDKDLTCDYYNYMCAFIVKIWCNNFGAYNKEYGIRLLSFVDIRVLSSFEYHF